MGKAICSECGNECEVPFEPTGGKPIFCRDCYNNRRESEPKKDSYGESYMRQYHDDLDKNVIKGRVAEALVEQMFLSLEFDVFRYGIERILPRVAKSVREGETPKRDKTLDKLRSMPDFVVRNNISNKLFFVEVKYRADGGKSMKPEDIEKYPDDVYIILVSKGAIKCGYSADLKGRDTTFHLLADEKGFGFEPQDRDKIKKFCGFASKFFSNIDED